MLPRTTFVYDSVNRVSSSTDADNKPTTFEYDALSRTTTVIDALNQRYEFAYDLVGRQTGVTRGGVSMSYQYDAAGNRTQRTDYGSFVTPGFGTIGGEALGIGVGFSAGTAFGAAIGAGIGIAAGIDYCNTEVCDPAPQAAPIPFPFPDSIPMPPPPMQMSRGWTCKASCNIENFSRIPNAPDRVEGAGSGHSQEAACRSAKAAARARCNNSSKTKDISLPELKSSPMQLHSPIDLLDMGKVQQISGKPYSSGASAHDRHTKPKRAA